MKASEVRVGERYILGEQRGRGKIISTGRFVRVEEVGIPGSSWATRRDHSRMVEIVLNEETGEWEDRMVVAHWKPEEERVPYRNVMLRPTRVLISVEDYEREQAEAQAEKERREAWQKRRDEFQAEAVAIIAHRVGAYADLVTVDMGYNSDPEEDEFYIASATIKQEAVDEILAGSYPCEKCGKNGERKIVPVVNQTGVVVLLCEECKPEEAEAEDD
jgi:hypothetical protein